MNKKIGLVLVTVVFLSAYCNIGGSQLKKDAVLEVKSRKFNVQLADTPAERAQGLSGVASMRDDEGMLFLFSEPQTPEFWMKDMKIAIDIIWINGNRVIQIDDNVKPMPGLSVTQLPKYKPTTPADKVLEVNAGWAFRNDIQSGDTIKLSNP